MMRPQAPSSLPPTVLRKQTIKRQRPSHSQQPMMLSKMDRLLQQTLDTQSLCLCGPPTGTWSHCPVLQRRQSLDPRPCTATQPTVRLRDQLAADGFCQPLQAALRHSCAEVLPPRNM